MKRTCLVFLAFLVACASIDALPVAFNPDKAWFASGGWTCLSQSFVQTAAGTAEIEIPPGFLPESISVTVEGKRAPAWYAKETRAPDKEKKDSGAYRLVIGPLAKGDKARIGYYCKGVFSSEAILEIDLDLSLAHWKAALSAPGGFGLANCEAWLAAAIGPSGESGLRGRNGEIAPSGADILYPLGRIVLPARSFAAASVASVAIQPKHAYILEPASRVEVVDRVFFKNPFDFELCAASCLIRRGNIVVNRESLGYAVRGAELSVNVSIEREVEASRSASMKQVGPDDKPRPYEHTIRYELTNLKGEEIKATIAFNKKLGRRDPNLYVFEANPDSAAGDTYSWTRQVLKGGTMTVSFKILSNESSFSEYLDYEYYYGGR